MIVLFALISLFMSNVLASESHLVDELAAPKDAEMPKPNYVVAPLYEEIIDSPTKERVQAIYARNILASGIYEHFKAVDFKVTELKDPVVYGRARRAWHDAINEALREYWAHQRLSSDETPSERKSSEDIGGSEDSH